MVTFLMPMPAVIGPDIDDPVDQQKRITMRQGLEDAH